MISKVFNLVKYLFNRYYWGFINGHNYLKQSHYKYFESLINSKDNNIRTAYENKFASEIGEGKCISFASGRMAFYSFLKTIDIKEGDEVIITGSTCAVMVNAILRAGATPRFCDISNKTFGSCPKSINSLINVKTKVIVAQHSFGIPCEIDKIKDIATDNGIFLVEDCALAFKSKYKGKTLGNFGDIAIFSTDHSKPLNTLIGGILYTNKLALYNCVKKDYISVSELDISHQKRILKQIKIEQKYCNPKKYKYYKGLSFVRGLIHRVLNKGKESAFLISDSCSKITDSDYPYPAKLPVFLCELGSMELDRFDVDQRKSVLKDLKDAVEESYTDVQIPECYYDKDYDIVPLRFVFSTNNENIRLRISKFIDESWYWFKKPIIATKDDIINFGYQHKDCPKSENLGKNIINIPVIYGEESNKIVIEKIKRNV